MVLVEVEIIATCQKYKFIQVVKIYICNILPECVISLQMILFRPSLLQIIIVYPNTYSNSHSCTMSYHSVILLNFAHFHVLCGGEVVSLCTNGEEWIFVPTGPHSSRLISRTRQ